MNVFKKTLTLSLCFAIVLCALTLSGCGGKENDDNVPNPIATIEVEGYGTMKLELYYNKAPNTVKNFVSLANSDFYNGLIFHRVMSGFMIQGGDPKGTGVGGPGYSIRGEFSENGFEGNDISHERGVISMARASSFDTGGSQFFICHADRPDLDGKYAAFGKVIEGIDVVDKIAAVETDSNDKPLKDVMIKLITVDTQGVDIGEPETLKNS